MKTPHEVVRESLYDIVEDSGWSEQAFARLVYRIIMNLEQAGYFIKRQEIVNESDN